MTALYLLLPGDIDANTGGTIYDRHIAAGLRCLGADVRVRCLDGSFPFPTPQALQQARRLLAAIDDGAYVVIDGLVLGAMPEVVAAHRERLRLIGLVHHPLAFETGLDEATAAALYRSERSALRHVRHVIVTSPSTAALLEGYGVGAADIDVVEPGTESRTDVGTGPAPQSNRGEPGPLQLLCVGTVTPRKGHLLLVEALAQLTRLSWQLSCIGSLDRSPDTVAALRHRIIRLGLGQRVRLLGEIGHREMAMHYAAADLFVLPSLFEGYGMAYAEALAHDLPVLGTTAGAIPDTVPADAGLLVEPGAVPPLAAALQRLLTDRDLRCRLAAGARRARAHLPTWQDRAQRFAEVLNAV